MGLYPGDVSHVGPRFPSRPNRRGRIPWQRRANPPERVPKAAIEEVEPLPQQLQQGGLSRVTRAGLLLFRQELSEQEAIERKQELPRSSRLRPRQNWRKTLT